MRHRLRDGAAVVAHLANPNAHVVPDVAAAQPPTRTEVTSAPTTGAATTHDRTREMRGVQARTKWIWRGGLVTAFLVVTGVPALRRCSAENAWNRYVCECCEKSPRFAGNACARDGTNLADNDRWWIRFQFAKDGAGRPLEATHPGAEICARPKGRPEVCWPVKPPSPAPPLEVSTTDLTSGSTELVVRERGPRGTTELGRLDTTYSKGLTTSALCIGVWYTKTIVGTVNKVTFSVEPVGANLKACRGF